MDVFGLEGAAVSGTGEDELLPQPDGDGLATTQMETPPRDDDLIPEIGAPADSNPRERPLEIAAALETDEPLDPALEQLFREANAEAEEAALASELPDIPIQDLLNELVALGRRLGIEPSALVESANGAQASAGPDRGVSASEPPQRVSSDRVGRACDSADPLELPLHHGGAGRVLLVKTDPSFRRRRP